MCATRVSNDQQRTFVSTATLLDALHGAYTAGRPYALDAGTSVVVNASRVASSGAPTVDGELASRAWEHARRRAEDGSVLLESLDESTPSVLEAFLSSLPVLIPPVVYKALQALRPLLEAVSPQNPSLRRYSSLTVTLALSLDGRTLRAASISLPSSGIDTRKGLLNVPSESGYRAFDAFYYLLAATSSPAEREFLGLGSPSSYKLLERSGTYDPPSYLPTADDAASADDWRCSLREIGIKGSSHTNFWIVLAGLLKLGNTIHFMASREYIRDTCEDVGGLLGVDPEILARRCISDRESLIGFIYEALVDWVTVQANKAIAAELSRTNQADSSGQHGNSGSGSGASAIDGDTVTLNIVDIPDVNVGRAIALRDVFDRHYGILAEMAEDGVEVPGPSASILREVATAVNEAAIGPGVAGDAAQAREYERDRRIRILESVENCAEDGSFLKEIISPIVNAVDHFHLSTMASNSRLWHHLSIYPTSGITPKPLSTTFEWSVGAVSRQLRRWRLPEWASRRKGVLDFTADFDVDEFCARYAQLGCKSGKDGVESWALQRGWSSEVVVGREHVWMRESAWWEAEGMLDLNPESNATLGVSDGIEGDSILPGPNTGGGPVAGLLAPILSVDDYISVKQNSHGLETTTKDPPVMFKGPAVLSREVGDPYGVNPNIDRDYDAGPPVEVLSTSRRIWVALTWTLTFWIPSFVLSHVCRMKRSDVRMAWREKVTLFFLVSVVNAAMAYTMVRVSRFALLAFAIIFFCVRGFKTIVAVGASLSRDPRPPPQDKFVVCLVPVYTEGEDQMRKSIDSLAALQYDNKRKLICVICDGIVVGDRNDRPTPHIILNILGVDPKVDPPALPFKSIGLGNEELNYGRVYSGLYEHGGNVVPFIVVVKVGKESEQARAKPGHRGKRDSQVLLLQFLLRVHHRSAMSPLELEMFHQINNIIGVDPELYEYLLMIDADTRVSEDSLNRLVACCSRDSKVAGICGETILENEERSWWTMIQVYEYYTSYHLTKAFESVFGSVTCLPGCFCMYRLRTADKGRPLIISETVLNAYADGGVDTLHKRNLLSLGEDRFLTTLMMKQFPHMSYRFTGQAYAATTVPESWRVFYSQRRRWINSAIHNLVELVMLPDMCGWCCFSMRFVVLVDLIGTFILPATAISLGYLLYKVAKHSGLPEIISLVMVAITYVLQAMVFIIKRQWQHIGWMVIYVIAFPIYSVILPIYSFWKQDDFSWGGTRIAVGDKDREKGVPPDREEFDPARIPLQAWNDYAANHGLPGRRGLRQERGHKGEHEGDEFEMPDAFFNRLGRLLNPEPLSCT
ncbi:hypothetical protein GP486_007046 [Trichoglossum hirsutum]|uniref:chitin synthase n=1 Tax=Trichoglossum hirsutum TaxID=265104 RepID=A0A9P8II04_9PEZI|nr:hypothetical protein GP486_007046 [Trichoglossum hirsutum]